MRAPAFTPADTLRELRERSQEVRAAILLDGRELVASEPGGEELGERLRELTLALLEAADGADRDPVSEVEAATAAGAVYVARDGPRALAAVAGRFSLSSLMRYDMRRALAELGGGER